MTTLEATLELPPNFCLQVTMSAQNKLEIEPIRTRLLVPESGPRNVQFGPAVKQTDSPNRFVIEFHYEETEITA